MKEVRWQRMFVDELEKAFDECPVVYFPYGLCEPHGPQNAIGLDAIKAEGIAVETARATGGVVAPTDYWHVHEIGGYATWSEKNVGEVDRTWLTAVPPWVHFKNVCYHIRAADQIGFHAALFITGHYGPNWQDLNTLLALAQPYTKTRLLGFPDFEANVPGFDRDGKSGGDHAGKVETSLLWALNPELVDMTRVDGSMRPPAFAMGADAADANRREGERMVRDEVFWISNQVKRLLDEYDGERSVSGFPTFESVEQFWDRDVRPVVPDFKSMARDLGSGSGVDKGSRWHANWHVPDYGS